MKFCGIQFVPLNVTVKERLQTLAIAAWFNIFAFGGYCGAGVAICLILFSRLWWLISIYCFWVLVIDKETCNKGGRRSQWAENWLWFKYVRDYFPVQLKRLPDVELDPEKNYMFCCFPHGILPVGTFNTFCPTYGNFRQLFPHHRPHVATLTQHYMMPFYRDLMLSVGAVSCASKSIDYLLSKSGGGNVIGVVVGGAEEAFYSRPGRYEIVLKKRKGFVKLALKNGAPIVPVFTFGETDQFDQLDNPEGSTIRNLQEWVRKTFGVAPAVPIGRGFFQYSFGLIPRRVPINTVVGRPIDVDKIENPTQVQIDQLHQKFMEKLEELFEEQKHHYVQNANETKLIIR